MAAQCASRTILVRIHLFPRFSSHERGGSSDVLSQLFSVNLETGRLSSLSKSHSPQFSSLTKMKKAYGVRLYFVLADSVNNRCRMFFPVSGHILMSYAIKMTIVDHFKR